MQKAKSSASFDSPNTKYVCDSNNNNLNQPNQPLASSFSSVVESTEFLDVNIWNSVYNMFHKRLRVSAMNFANNKLIIYLFF